MELILENVRSFAGRHNIPIKPLTLLTGENSSGKSTLLAALSIVTDNYSFPLNPRFNISPYTFGNYDSVATSVGTNSRPAESFSLGIRQTQGAFSEQIASYVSRDGLIDISWTITKTNALELEFEFLSLDGEPIVGVRFARDNEPVITQRVSYNLESRSKNYVTFAFHLLFPQFMSDSQGTNEILGFLEKMVAVLDKGVQSHSLSIAPMRVKPRRTYDEITEEFSPEGEHIPYVLSRLLADESARTIVERFGIESGLYSKLEVKRLGKQRSDPQQVMVMSSGEAVNLIDVGYGVSQVLPILVQSILAAEQTLLLVQQPEVHLHPRAQAALGSLFVDLVVQGRKQFVVETHSDYIIDRVRMEVAKGTIPAEDVSILYLEKPGLETKVYPLSLNKAGDIVDAPPSYRAFFLEEELNLFNRTER